MEKDNCWKGRNILITGGSGFIGSRLTKDLLKKGAKVTCLSRKKENYRLSLNGEYSKIFKDITTMNSSSIKSLLETNKINYVFHLAGQSILSLAKEKPLETIQTNIMGTLNILEACRLSKKLEGIVIVSSINVYSPNGKMPYTEKSALFGEHPYSVATISQDLMAQSFGKLYNLPIGIARFSNVYGGGDFNFNRLTPKVVESIIKNNPIKVEKSLRSFLYIDDASKALICLGKKLNELDINGEAFNFGAELPIPVDEFVSKFVEVSKKDYTGLEIIDKKGKDQYSSIEKAKTILGWSPKYGLNQGLKETFKWYEKYFKKI